MGETKGWELLADLDPAEVSRNALAQFDHETGHYRLRSFHMDIVISVHDRSISCSESDKDGLSPKLWDYAGLTFIWYLINAKDIPLTGRHERPENLKGGHLFSKGTHVLPLEELAEKYNDDPEGFYKRGESLGAERLNYGDASIRIIPLPRIPVTIILWRGDDEFPARADLLFDSSCGLQVPVDILWSAAMMSVLIMM